MCRPPAADLTVQKYRLSVLMATNDFPSNSVSAPRKHSPASPGSIRAQLATGRVPRPQQDNRGASPQEGVLLISHVGCTRRRRNTGKRRLTNKGSGRPGSLCPVLPIGADGLAVEDQSQGRRGLRAIVDATGGSALDCDLYAARCCQARRTGHARLARGAIDECVTAGHHRPSGNGGNRPASSTSTPVRSISHSS